ncbi:gluconate operon transcriptional repressor GntR [Zophobihabitans entericus]|uniref:Gluconate operon transcriptional repressor GntR n=1 Tax=Zophobihabitans entericus TaxID=1635327 RepID=A0A6G9ID95_9GAMM|nr:gluconate operon transcriptional repressor GntR [Zophobihabitans entericus]QIQ22208.1 gluconate operon transcriptional repressor GntR [Zophobihabitans entericus]
MKKRRTGLLDIANIVGVSKMTVSRFLRDPNLVSPALQQQLSEAIDKLGYIPNKAPNMLSNAKSHAIGVFLPSLTNQVFAEVLKGIEMITDKAGYQTMIAHTGYYKDKEEMRLRSLLSYNVDGLILTERIHTPNTLKMIELADIPVVEMMDSVSPCIDMAVGFDNFTAAKNIVNRIISKGKKNIVYVGARLDERSIIRQKGYEAAMQENGLNSYTISTKELSSYTLGGKLLHQALKENDKVDGIFCSNDNLALGVLFECQRINIKVPEQLAIAGFHGHDVGRAVTPQLASVLTPRMEMGKIAAEMLLKRLSGEKLSSSVIDLPVQYLDGGSI